ncbi:hypothetical protein HZA40_04095 [Candidatus Peregrinibacteria bacterium]|nr:hypothetical protein [Candidatus Peregrinibacteria bacterium]
MAESSSVRPWQGTALGVLDIIYTVLLFLGGLAFLAFQGLISGFLGATGGAVDVNGVKIEGVQGVLGMLAGLGMVLGVVLLGLGILHIFMTRGAFKGQKWSPILSIVFAALTVVGSLSNFDSNGALNLVAGLFTLYVAVMCVKSPYYNRAK